MTVSFHCQSCKKKIKASEKAGGKWGKCPHCGIKCYIPLPPAPEEELKLIPLEEEVVSSIEQQMQETRDLQYNILQETEVSDKGDPLDAKFTPEDKKQLFKNIIMYLRLMADGELGQADQVIGKIARHSTQAKEALAEMFQNEEPEPELADIAPGVLKGMMKNLVAQLNEGGK